MIPGPLKQDGDSVHSGGEAALSGSCQHHKGGRSFQGPLWGSDGPDGSEMVGLELHLISCWNRHQAHSSSTTSGGVSILSRVLERWWSMSVSGAQMWGGPGWSRRAPGL